MPTNSSTLGFPFIHMLRLGCGSSKHQWAVEGSLLRRAEEKKLMKGQREGRQQTEQVNWSHENWTASGEQEPCLNHLMSSGSRYTRQLMTTVYICLPLFVWNGRLDHERVLKMIRVNCLMKYWGSKQERGQGWRWNVSPLCKVSNRS